MNQCKICQSINIHKKNQLYICNSCYHGYRIYDEDIIEFHKKKYRDIHKKNKNEIKNNIITEIFHKSREKIINNRLKKIKNYINKNDNVLDIGSGAGTFALSIQDSVNHIDCLEIDPRLIEESRRLGLNTFDQDFLRQNFVSKYDIIFAWHVLEHIENIHAFINKCSMLANKYIIIEVPTNRKPSKIFEGHLHYFTEISLRYLCESLSLQTISITEGIQKPSILGIFIK